MAKITNHYNLPQPVYNALARDDYSKGPADISVTELFQPPQIRSLRRLNDDKIEEDAIDRIWSLLGTSIHKILEDNTDTLRLSEQRFYTTYEGYTISGQADSLILREGVIQDWKLTSSWSVMLRSRDDDWTRQLNAYAWLLGRPHYTMSGTDRVEDPLREVKSLQVVAFLRDWSKLEAKRNMDYPQKQIEVIDIPLFDRERMDEIIKDRLHAHRNADHGIVAPCTDEEMWAKPAKFAVMKPGRERAIKLANTREEAEAWLRYNMKPNEAGYVQERPGQRTRCESYCNVSRFCPQFAAWRAANGKDEPEGML